jgi:hypothetical protein
LLPASSTNEDRADADRIIAEQHRWGADAEAALAITRAQFDATDRVLLIGTDDPLVDMVTKALEDFGFEVKNVDEERRAQGLALREDLQVSDGDWLSLCEVKGYGKGAKASDLTKLATLPGRYFFDTGKSASAIWCVVNHQRGHDPSLRPLPLRGHEDHIQVLADEQNGLVIDTRDLFGCAKPWSPVVPLPTRQEGC